MGDLPTVLEERREELLRRWSEALHRSLPRAAPGELPSPSELFELLHGLTRALGEHPSSASPPAAFPWLSRGDPLLLALAVYESLGEAVTDVLQEEGGVLSPGEARVLTRFITSGIAAAGAPREPSRVTEGRLLPESLTPLDAHIEREWQRLLASEKAARQEAEEANRLKDEFLATVSHELRTPLTAMLGWVQVLRNGNLPPEKRERALETVERNARAQGQLIEDLLDVSRIMSGKLKLDVGPVEVGHVVEQALESVRPAADAKGLRLQTALDSTGHVMGDAHRLQQVVWNLLSNAVKFTPKGGRVQVFVERRDSAVEITVADTGRGIAPEFLPHVFEHFRQAEGLLTRRAGGLGLGLSIVKQLVEMHGGTVAAFSEGVGQGATFTVRLPLSAAMRREATLPPSLQHAHPGIPCPPELTGLRVLVVDDEQDTRELLRTLLEECHAEVSTAASVAEGLERLKQELPDVLISDIGMPGEDGFHLISRVRALPPKEGGRTPAVALTAYARVEDRTRALLAGFHSHVPKPVEPVELLVVLASLSGRFGAVRG
ncbi:Chemotaxis protein methyltransferase CheR [Cystobacter fuscus DSM 2262]|uniref:histidine kinase n=1 Tax=Cystobacter fuscus (strain ATCC 25194 / DSM 2262 / NBRC 100088 / M29) TaxID=1242864 RepID=S9PL97_CYSF2|nr:ATP-binding protein [Cystobacter fuscus]EPX63806.1 Chemotaxis protein methyltransferase CheR [Cystobacter fuscus DSM 2262]